MCSIKGERRWLGKMANSNMARPWIKTPGNSPIQPLNASRSSRAPAGVGAQETEVASAMFGLRSKRAKPYSVIVWLFVSMRTVASEAVLESAGIAVKNHWLTPSFPKPPLPNLWGEIDPSLSRKNYRGKRCKEALLVDCGVLSPF